MKNEKIYVMPVEAVAIPQSVLHEIFLDDVVATAYLSFKKKGYVRKLKKILHTLVVSKVPTDKDNSFEEDIITTYIVKIAIEKSLFLEANGDLKKSITYIMGESSWLKEIDAEYESILEFERKAHETVSQNEELFKPNHQYSSKKPTLH